MSKVKEKKIVLTGGHAATTALATALTLKKRWENIKIYWIGVKTAFEGEKTQSLESKILPKEGIIFKSIIAGRLQRRFTIWTIPSILKIPIGFIQSFRLIWGIRPDVVLSFGGFASVPVVVSAFFLGIPVVLHEQTSEVGRANLFSSRFAKIVALARETSRKYFIGRKAIVVGNPTLNGFYEVRPVSTPKPPLTIFVTGGSRGSFFINKLVKNSLNILLPKYKIIHQTGTLQFNEFTDVKKNLPRELSENYKIFERLDPVAVTKIFDKSSIIISRAGANTISEIVASVRPAVLIPIPWSYDNEQVKNAELAKSIGIADIIEEEMATPELLANKIEHICVNYSKIVKHSGKNRFLDKEASEKLVDILGQWLN